MKCHCGNEMQMSKTVFELRTFITKENKVDFSVVPEGIELPRCFHCGEMWIDKAAAQAFDAATKQVKQQEGSLELYLNVIREQLNRKPEPS